MATEQITIGIRGTADTKARLEKLAEQTGLSQKDLLEKLLDIYEAVQQRETMGEIKELEQLRYFLTRIEQIYIAFVQEARDKEHQNAEVLAAVQEELKKAKALALEAREEAEKRIKEAEEQAEAARAESALIREQAEKEIQQMKIALDRAQEAQEQASRLAVLAEKAAATAEARAKELEEIANRAQELQAERDKLAAEKRELERQITIMKADHEKKIKALYDEMTTKMQQASLEKDRAILEVERRFMEEVGRLKDALARLREEKAQLEIALVKAEKNNPAEKNKNVEDETISRL